MGNLFWLIVWLLILFFVSFYVAGFCAGWYIILYPLTVCIDAITVSEKWSVQCTHWVECSPEIFMIFSTRIYFSHWLIFCWKEFNFHITVQNPRWKGNQYAKWSTITSIRLWSDETLILTFGIWREANLIIIWQINIICSEPFWVLRIEFGLCILFEMNNSKKKLLSGIDFTTYRVNLFVVIDEYFPLRFDVRIRQSLSSFTQLSSNELPLNGYIDINEPFGFV